MCRMVHFCDRGQTTVDFAIAISIFLVAVVFTLTLVPSLFQPYDNTAEEQAVSDRAATTLSSNVLTNPQDKYILDNNCTEEFFQQMTGTASNVGTNCRFPDNTFSLREMFRFSNGVFMNVTIEDTSGNVQTFNGTEMRAGDSVPDVADTTVSTRVVLFNGDKHYLKVVTW